MSGDNCKDCAAAYKAAEHFLDAAMAELAGIPLSCGEGDPATPEDLRRWTRHLMMIALVKSEMKDSDCNPVRGLVNLTSPVIRAIKPRD